MQGPNFMAHPLYIYIHTYIHTYIQTYIHTRVHGVMTHKITIACIFWWQCRVILNYRRGVRYLWFSNQKKKNKINLLIEYKNIIRKVLSLMDSILQNAKQLQHARLSWHLRCPSGIEFSYDINLESRFILNVVSIRHQQHCKDVILAVGRLLEPLVYDRTEAQIFMADWNVEKMNDRPPCVTTYVHPISIKITSVIFRRWGM
jgi:hypothetical protein